MNKNEISIIKNLLKYVVLDKKFIFAKTNNDKDIMILLKEIRFDDKNDEITLYCINENGEDFYCGISLIKSIETDDKLKERN